METCNTSIRSRHPKAAAIEAALGGGALQAIAELVIACQCRTALDPSDDLWVRLQRSLDERGFDGDLPELADALAEVGFCRDDSPGFRVDYGHRL